MTDIAELGFRVDSAQAVKATSDLDRLGDQATQTERQVVGAATRSGKAFSSMASPMRDVRSAFSGFDTRMAAMQLSQVAQQTSATGNFVQSLAIQLPDLALGFGTIGIAAGVAAGALLPVAASMFDLGDGSRTLEDELDRLDEVISSLQVPIDILEGDLDELADRFGTNTARVREYAVALAEIRAAEARDALKEQVSLLRDSAGSYYTAIDAGRSYRNTLSRIAEDFGLAGAQAREFETLIQRAATAPTFSQQQSALAEILSYLEQSGIAVSEIPPEMRSALAAMIEASNSADELAAAAERADAAARGTADGAGGIVGPVSAAADEAGRLAGNLSSAMAALAAVEQGIVTANRRAANQLRIRRETIGDPAGRAAGLARESYREESGMAAYQAISAGNTSAIEDIARSADQFSTQAATLAAAEEDLRAAEKRFAESTRARSGGGRKGGSGGRGGKSDAQREAERRQNEMTREAERIFDDTRTAAERYARELKDLNELHEMGYLDADTFGRAVEQLNEEMQEASFERINQGIQSISDAMANAIVNGESMGEALANVFRQIAADILSAGIQQALMQVFAPAGGAGGGGLFGSIVGAIFGGGGGQTPIGEFGPGASPLSVDGLRAKGGPVEKGRTYVVGEQGPEVWTAPDNGVITPNHQLGGLTTPSRISMDIAITEKDGLVAIARDAAGRAIGEARADLARDAVAAVDREGRRSKSLMNRRG